MLLVNNLHKSPSRAQVDQASETVLVPLYGVMVPFHILMVRNISSSQEGDHAYIRLNFNFGPSFEPSAKHPNALFLKELSFRTADSRHSTKVSFGVHPWSCSVSLQASGR